MKDSFIYRNNLKCTNINVQFTDQSTNDKDSLHIINDKIEEQFIVKDNYSYTTFNFSRNIESKVLGSNLAKYLFHHTKLLCYKNIVINFKEIKDNLDQNDFIAGFKLTAWKFDKYKTEKQIKIANLVIISNNTKEYEKKNLVESALIARELCCEPSNVLNTEELKNHFQELEKLSDDVTVEILDEAALKEKNLNGIYSVGYGSHNPSYLVIVKYKYQKHNAFGLIGKGVVFDTGGTSLKAPKPMIGMNGDMGGAAAVYGALRALILDNQDVSVIAAIPIVENILSSKAIKPGDIIESSGKTIEVLNTDAEGRLILQDAISYLSQMNVSHMITVATLTGAIKMALSSVRAGLFSNNDKFAKCINSIGDKIYEKCLTFPMDKEYESLLKGNHTDIANISHITNEAGSIFAAKYLELFLESKIQWAHLDIAGVNTVNRNFDMKLQSTGETSFGTRLLYNTVMSIQNNHYDPYKI